MPPYTGKRHDTIRPGIKLRAPIVGTARLQDIFVDLAEAGVPFTNHAVYGGHAWATWRQNIVYMLENVLWR